METESSVDEKIQCSITQWYYNFKDITFRTKLLALSQKFVKFLEQDSIVVPESFFPKYQKSSDDDIDDSKWDDDGDESDDDDSKKSDQIKVEDLKEVDLIQKVLDETGVVFIKTNWSSPQDATWMIADGTLKCKTVGEVLLLLKSSDFVSHDLNQIEALEKMKTLYQNDSLCQKHLIKKPPLNQNEFSGLFLALRQYYNLNPGMEFRCFIRNRKLVGISQREHTRFFQFLPSQREKFQQIIEILFNENIKDKFTLSNFVFDVYIDQKDRGWLLDFNPWTSTTDSLLFDWGEHPLSEQTSNSDQLSVDLQVTPRVEFRIIERKEDVRAIPSSKYTHNRVPQDMFDVSSAEAIASFAEFVKSTQKSG